MMVREAHERDIAGFLALAAQVEQWFGPMVDDPGFRAAVHRSIERGRALVAAAPAADHEPNPDLLGGVLFGGRAPTYHVHWLVVARSARGTGVGRAMMAEATRRMVREPGRIEVVTFGADHPGAADSGARTFYERLGYTAAEAAEPGPEGGSRQVYRLLVP